MTDNEIIKDLETCFDIKGCAKCSHNDGLSHCVFCIRTLLKDALGLINRQKAEIERLQENEQIATAVIAESSAEIERLEKARQKQAQFLGEERGQKYELLNKITTVKSEAVREFWLKLKDEISSKYAHTDIRVFAEGDNLIKKMVGDAECTKR